MSKCLQTTISAAQLTIVYHSTGQLFQLVTPAHRSLKMSDPKDDTVSVKCSAKLPSSWSMYVFVGSVEQRPVQKNLLKGFFFFLSIAVDIKKKNQIFWGTSNVFFASVLFLLPSFFHCLEFLKDFILALGR